MANCEGDDVDPEHLLRLETRASKESLALVPSLGENEELAYTGLLERTLGETEKLLVELFKDRDAKIIAEKTIVRDRKIHEETCFENKELRTELAAIKGKIKQYLDW
eukprot:3435444-Rhodomonas_salina.2